VQQAVTMDAKEAGNIVYALMAETNTLEMYRALHKAMIAGEVRACHDVSEGGLAVTAAEMCIGGRLGMSLTIDTADPAMALFGEGNGRLLVEVRLEHCRAFEAHFDQAIVKRIGVVTNGERLNISSRTQASVSVSLADVVAAWQRIN
jgi:phosphoribosylformylglycinamidine (FGAM) synthase-like enzyme